MELKRQHQYLLIQLFLSTIFARTDGLCLLCSNGVAGLKRPMFNFVDTTDRGRVKNCVAKSLEMASDLQEGSSECSASVNGFRQICCGNADPGPPAEAEVDPPRVYRTGPYDSCDICKGDGPPGNPRMVINMLYLSAGTCEDYYYLGLNGNFQPHLCPPLKLYGYSACGCGRSRNNQAPQKEVNVNGASVENRGNNNGNNNDANNANASNNEDELPRRRDPPTDLMNKRSVSYGAGRGGSSGNGGSYGNGGSSSNGASSGNGGHRYLKGSKAKG